MEKINPIQLEIQPIRKVKLPFKIVAFILTLIFVFNPLYDLIDIFNKSFPHGWCCQPFICTSYLNQYHFL